MLDADNYFVFVQFKDSIHNKSFKFRTEIVPTSERPRFLRSNFTFEDIEAEEENALTLKFGLFVTKLQHDLAELSQQQLIVQNNHTQDQSVSAGTASFKFNLNVLSQLQEKSFIEHSLPFMHDKQEVGRIYFAVRAAERRLDYLVRTEDN